jgi:hypothetical protein
MKKKLMINGCQELIATPFFYLLPIGIGIGIVCILG